MLEEVPEIRVVPAGSARLSGLDAFRGLIMVLMALDHAKYFVALVHQSEIWYRPLPVGGDALRFLTRFVTHFCAPGFFLLMGAGAALFAASRQNAGWSHGRIASSLALRGLFLVALQFLVENPAWSVSDTGSLGFAPYFGVLYGLGTALVFWSMLIRLPDVAVLAVSLTAVAGTQVLVPLFGNPGGPQSAWLGYLLVPGAVGKHFILYPPIPWLGVAGLGIWLGRLLRRNPAQALAGLYRGGFLALAAFIALRVAGAGDFRIPTSTGWMMFLNLTKYPPSLDYLLLTLGVSALLLRLFLAEGERPGDAARLLAVYGRVPLFFYLAHLYVYALMGVILGQPVPLPAMYLFWLAGLALLYPPCIWYGRFKRSTPATSLWRML